ncbi:MotA/TolQ/ExbB proton channel family protein [Polynucleobacter sp. MWH-UH19D]|uniref:MotA/TolQ/ExbB proton channel family protein n=1 Tax=Polynucleobacter sp. MWH-UH19D TaxID=1855610 RepID=UPI003364B7BD
MYSILLSAGWPIWPLLIISIIGLAIAIERYWYLRFTHIFPEGLLESVFSSANQLVNQSSNQKLDDTHLENLIIHSPASPLLTCVLKEKIVGSNTGVALEELQVVAQSTWLKFDRYLGALATIATIAPLLGLFGTVVGMIEIFGSQGAIDGAGSPQQLAHGISVALYNTAFGLLIAIPALAAWRGLRSMANQRQRECEEFTRQLFKKLF